MAEHIQIRITRVSAEAADLPLPSYATEGSAGVDLCAAVASDLAAEPGATVLVPTGFRIELPEGFEAQVRPRSGLAVRHSVGVLNAPGTIDSDYRGEIKIVLHNFGTEPFVIRRGDRIAQMIIARYARVEWQEVSAIADTGRGAGGFGHTGVAQTSKG